MLSGIEGDFHANHLPRIRDILLFFFFFGGQLRDTEDFVCGKEVRKIVSEEGGERFIKIELVVAEVLPYVRG